MARRTVWITIFTAIWLVVLMVPPLRRLMQVHAYINAQATLLKANTDSDENVVAIPPTTAFSLLDRYLPLQQPSVKDIAARHPHDVCAQVMALDGASESLELPIGTVPRFQHDSQFRRQYDRLFEQFPATPWLIAKRLRRATLASHDNRMAGDLENPYTDHRPVPRSSWPDMTRAEISSDIAYARLGQRLEPANTYFDWILAWLLFAAHRDGAALSVLHQAAAKPFYDDHTRDDVRARLAVLELDRPLLVEEKTIIAARELLPHLAKQRHVARLAVWSGMRLQGQGEHRRAAQIYADLARLGGTMRDGSNLLIGGLVGRAIQMIAWEHGQQQTDEERRILERITSAEDRQNVSMEFHARVFTDYVAAHGGGNLAAPVAAQMEVNRRFTANSQTLLRVAPAGVSIGTWKEMCWLAWLAELIPLQVQLLAVLWLSLGGLVWQERYRAPVHRFDVAMSVLWVLMISAVLMAGALFVGAGSVELGLWSEAGEQDYHTGDSGWILGLSWLLLLAPVVGGAIYCSVAMLWRQRKALGLRLARLVSRATTADTPQAVFGRVPATEATPRRAADGLLLVPPRHDWGWYHQTLGALLIIISVLHLVLLLASLPLRQAAAAEFQTTLQVGENAMAAHYASTVGGSPSMIR